MAPQIIYLVVFLIGFGLNAHLHGEPKTYPNVDFWSWLGAWIVWAVLLWWGGWFDCFFKA